MLLPTVPSELPGFHPNLVNIWWPLFDGESASLPPPTTPSAVTVHLLFGGTIGSVRKFLDHPFSICARIDAGGVGVDASVLAKDTFFFGPLPTLAERKPKHLAKLCNFRRRGLRHQWELSECRTSAKRSHKAKPTPRGHRWGAHYLKTTPYMRARGVGGLTMSSN